MNYKEYTVRIFKDGDKEYFQNGLLHRTDGPAVELSNGAKYYYQKGRLHRMDGPAVMHNNGTKEYYIDGKELTEEEFTKRKD